MRISNLLRPALLALVGAALSPQAHAANPYTPGDLFLGFRASGGQGATQDYLVNIGPASNYTAPGSSFTLPSIGSVGADLTSIFGSNWRTRTDLFWSISGGSLGADPVNTLYATRARTAAGVPITPWQGRSNSSQSFTDSKFDTLAEAYKNADPVTAGHGLQQAVSSTNSYASFQPGGTAINANGISFASFNPTIESAVANSAGLELFRLVPVLGLNGASQGVFTIDAGGTVTYVPASGVTSGASVYLSQASYSVSEGVPTGKLTVTVVRSAALAGAVTVNLSATNGSALSGTDFTSPGSATVSFAANETEKTVDIPIINRAGDQGNRTFNIQLASASSGTTILAPSTAVVTITDVDSVAVGFATTTQSHTPRVGGLDQLTFNVAVQRTSSSGTASATVSVDATLTVTAPTKKLVSPANFTISPTTVNFGIGETSKNVTVTLTSTAPTPGQFRLRLTGAVPGLKAGFDKTVITVLKKDTAKPIVKVTSPAATVPTPGTFTLAGTVQDDDASDLSSFAVTLNGQPVTVTRDAYAAGVAKNFGAGLQAENGTNTLVVTATDAQGNTTVLTKNFVFSNSTLGQGFAGTYNGVLVPSAAAGAVGSDNDTSGFVTITITPAAAAFSGKITLGGITVPLTGQLNNGQTAIFKATLKPTFDLIDKTEFDSFLGTLSFAVSGSEATGVLQTSATGGSTLATFTAERIATTTPASLLNQTSKGLYNVKLPSEDQTPSLAHTLYPQGDGVASLALAANGVATLKGYLADGTAFTAAGRLATDNSSVAFYAPLYKKLGSLAGNLAFDLLATDTDVSGANLLWIRPNQPRARYYKSGWPNGLTVDAVGTRYNGVASVNFGLAADDLSLGNATLGFDDGGLTNPIPKAVNINATNGVVKLIPATATDYKLTLAAGTGLFSGFFTYPDTSKPAFKGVILNKGLNKGGFGYFLSPAPATYVGSGESGSVTLQAKQ